MQREHPPEFDVWSDAHSWKVPADQASLKAGSALEAQLARMKIPEALWGHLKGTALGLGDWVASCHQGTPLLIGINGAQGSGKSTTAELLATTLHNVHGIATVQCSIDDFYLTHGDRQKLAREIHPLLKTRGVPGTHDMGLLYETLDRLMTAGAEETTAIPGFSKAKDDRLPESLWIPFKGRADVVILEGWCVGTTAQPESLIKVPLNDLESQEDPDEVWRRYVNQALSDSYQAMFQRLEQLIFLKVPDFSAVFEWRSLQEQKLKDQAGHSPNSRIMDASALKRFIMHFERLTRWNLETLPTLADLTLEIDRNHRFQKASP